MKIVVLGSGGSMGTPIISCKCPVCLSNDPKDRRLRSSLLVEIAGKKFLIDATPDTRQVALHYKIDYLDGVFITHFHEDHIGGINDLRPFFFLGENKPLPLVLSQNTHDMVCTRYAYLMNRFDIRILEELIGRANLHEVQFQYYTYSQQGVPVNGYRFGNFAYLTDIKEFRDDIFEWLRGVKVLILSFIHERGSEMHFSLNEALSFVKKAKPERTYFTHVSHEVGHEEINRKLPHGIQIAYDGQIIEV